MLSFFLALDSIYKHRGASKEVRVIAAKCISYGVHLSMEVNRLAVFAEPCLQRMAANLIDTEAYHLSLVHNGAGQLGASHWCDVLGHDFENFYHAPVSIGKLVKMHQFPHNYAPLCHNNTQAPCCQCYLRQGNP